MIALRKLKSRVNLATRPDSQPVSCLFMLSVAHPPFRLHGWLDANELESAQSLLTKLKARESLAAAVKAEAVQELEKALSRIESPGCYCSRCESRRYPGNGAGIIRSCVWGA